MSKQSKLLARLLSRPADFTWDEMVSLVGSYGFAEKPTKGGSHRVFMDAAKRKLFLAKPHPGNIVKRYALSDVISKLEEYGLISPQGKK